MLLLDLITSDSFLRSLLTYNEQEIDKLAIKGLSANSKEIKPGYLFVATKGALKNSQDGHDFIDQAILQGAVAIVTDSTYVYKKDLTVPIIRAKNSRQALAFLCEAFYQWPSKDLTIIGITGTNGKTSTSFMVQNILKSAGKKAYVMGTLGIGEPGHLKALSHTTASPEVLSHYFFALREQGISHVVMEVSSHAIAQERVCAVDFSLVAFTNLSHDHLDFHGTMENYRNAKEKLFLNIAKPETKKVLPADHGLDARINSLSNIVLFKEDASLADYLPYNDEFYSKNALLAANIAKALNIDTKSIKNGLRSCPNIPGRLERIYDGGPTIIVDFAHTPDAFKGVLKILKAKTKGRLIVVFGSGGNRDQRKRPMMGKIASEIADIIFITDDNPRDEDPKLIRASIKEGIPEGFIVHEISDRKEAILRAIKLAHKQDLVLIAGKGHEDYQIIGAKVNKFSDQQEALKAIGQLCKI